MIIHLYWIWIICGRTQNYSLALATLLSSNNRLISRCGACKQNRDHHQSTADLAHTFNLGAMSSAISYNPNYFSLEDIIVTQERVPCIVETRLVGMGQVDPSAMDADLEVGKKVEFPLWYAMHFDCSRTRHVKCQIPDIYKKISKEVCEADANAVELGRMNKFFYEFGRYVTRFDRVGYIGPMLVDACRQRSRLLMDLCKGNLNDYKNDTRLENLEKALYVAGCRTNQKFSRWLLADSSTINTAELVVQHRKRKRAQQECI